MWYDVVSSANLYMSSDAVANPTPLGSGYDVGSFFHVTARDGVDDSEDAADEGQRLLQHP